MDRLTMDGPLNRWMDANHMRSCDLAGAAAVDKSVVCRVRSGRQRIPAKFWRYWRETGVPETDLAQIEVEHGDLMAKRGRLQTARRAA